MEKDLYFSHFYNQMNDSNSNFSQQAFEKTKNILKLLNATKINHDLLQSCCFQGIPDECNGLRSLCWRILMGYISDWPSKWGPILETRRKTYTNYLREFILSRQGITIQSQKDPSEDPLKSLDPLMPPEDPLGLGGSQKFEEESKLGGNSNKNGKTGKGPKRAALKTNNDFHPLGVGSIVASSNTAQDYILWDDILKDTKRTRAEMDFFSKLTDFPLCKLYNKEKPKADVAEQETHIEVLTRILYIFGKLNPDLNYIQGMNELLAPIYHCFYNDQNPVFRGYAEADSFFCFMALMEELKESFAKSFDHEGVGIQARIKALNQMLQKVDKTLWDHLEKHGVDPQFYSLRWLMLFLTQEFMMNDVLRLWDTLLSHPKKFEYLNCICIAMLQQVRKKVMSSDEFSTIMETLQKDTVLDLDKSLKSAFKIYKEFTKPEDIINHIAFSV